nr:glycosyltransferase family 2 protein [Conchiformibius kuhniae]
MTIDAVIPCYNASATLHRAVVSVLRQPEIRRIHLIDDASDDDTWHVITRLAAQFPQIRPERLPDNGGAARARNWGALQSTAPFIAFLDADDEYENGALAAAAFALSKFDYLGLVRLKLRPMHFPERYTAHPDFARAWRVLAMTVGGNTVFRRHFFLACGGFPQHGLFRSLGGEDGALGIATVQNSVVGTLFDAGEPVPCATTGAKACTHSVCSMPIFSTNTMRGFRRNTWRKPKR